MSILILNSGSSSIKFQLRDSATDQVLCKGLLERIGEPESRVKVTAGERVVEKNLALSDHAAALQFLLSALLDSGLNVLGSLSEIEAVGHRVVHGGELYWESVLIDDYAIKTIHLLSNLAPLHNPPNLKGIEACRAIMPEVPQVAVFDTAFYHSLPPKAYMYPLPRALYERYQIRRYGFHGTSHCYVSRRALALSGLTDEPSRIITAHLGNGCSITALRDGKAVDTSMGFTPLSGLVMGTRPGDIDASLPLYLLEKGMSPDEVQQILQKKSGLLGLSDLSNDMRTLLENAPTNPKAQLAVDVFCYRLKKYIGSYSAVLGGLDVLAFTGGIGENAATIRALTCADMEYLGIEVDTELNNSGSGKESLISTENSKVKVYVIPTDEELMIGEETKLILEALRS